MQGLSPAAEFGPWVPSAETGKYRISDDVLLTRFDAAALVPVLHPGDVVLWDGLTPHKAPQMRQELEQRVRVLEQIVTDGGMQTAAQIEALRAPRLTGERK